MKKWIFKYKWRLLVIVILFNTALFVKFLYDQNWIGDSYNVKMQKRTIKAFEKQEWKSDVFKQKDKFRQFFSFLFRHSDSLLNYHVQQKFKIVKMDNGGTFMYQKPPDVFVFYNWKNMYEYIPENLQDSLQRQFKRFNGLVTGFSIESPERHKSIDSRKVAIRLRIQEDEEMYQNYISHSVTMNRKTDKSNQQEYLIKDTILDKDVNYIITAFLAQIK